MFEYIQKNGLGMCSVYGCSRTARNNAFARGAALLLPISCQGSNTHCSDSPTTALRGVTLKKSLLFVSIRIGGSVSKGTIHDLFLVLTNNNKSLYHSYSVVPWSLTFRTKYRVREDTHFLLHSFLALWLEGSEKVYRRLRSYPSLHLSLSTR